MLAKQYAHRLPANYDIELIRSRAAQRGAAWDNTEGLVFKAFIFQEKGKLGAAGHAYSSVYLWNSERAAAAFLMGNRFQGVIDMFGHPQIETWLPLDARRGSARDARFMYREDVLLQGGDDREAELQEEAQRSKALAKDTEIHTVVTAVDVLNWRLVRFVLTSQVPDLLTNRKIYEVLYLAQPGMAGLPAITADA
jgi:hypothetical protein